MPTVLVARRRVDRAPWLMAGVAVVYIGATLVLLPVAMTLGARATRPMPVADEASDAEDTV